MAASLDSCFKRTTASLSPNPDTLSCTSLFIFPHDAYHLIYMTHLLPDPHPWVYKLLGGQGLRTFSFYLLPVFFSAGSPVPGTWAHMWERHFKNVDWMNEPQTPLEFIRISFQAREQSVCLSFSSDVVYMFVCIWQEEWILSSLFSCLLWYASDLHAVSYSPQCPRGCSNLLSFGILVIYYKGCAGKGCGARLRVSFCTLLPT